MRQSRDLGLIILTGFREWYYILFANPYESTINLKLWLYIKISINTQNTSNICVNDNNEVVKWTTKEFRPSPFPPRTWPTGTKTWVPCGYVYWSSLQVRLLTKQSSLSRTRNCHERATGSWFQRNFRIVRIQLGLILIRLVIEIYFLIQRVGGSKSQRRSYLEKDN